MTHQTGGRRLEVMNWTPDDWERLGSRVRTERESQGLSREALGKSSGVAIGTIQNAEGRAVPKGRWPHSLSAIEKALGWAPGSMRAILDGGEPRPLSARPAEPIDGTTRAFAAWLRGARDREGMSQQQVAAALNIDGLTVYQQTIAKIETGDRADIPLSLAAALTRMFGTTLDAALGLGDDEPRHATERGARRTALLQHLRDQIDAELSA